MTLRARLMAARPGLGSRLRRWVPAAEDVPDWALPPPRGPLDPRVRVRVVGSERLRLGLAEVWDVRDHRPDFTVVEFPTRSQEWRHEISVVAARGVSWGEAFVIWATYGGPPSDPAALEVVTAATAVFVADPEQLAAWHQVAPAATLLPPAASARVRPRLERDGVAVVGTGRLSPAVAGLAATVVTRALRPLEEQLVSRRVETEQSLPRVAARAASGDGSYAEARDAVASAAVLADGLRRSVHDTWTLLDAAAAGVPAVTPGLPSPVPVVDALSASSYRAELLARLQQPELRDREGLRARRAVLAGHTWAHRADQIATTAFSDRPFSPFGAPQLAFRGKGGGEVSVSAIVATNRAHELDNVLANIGRQRHTNLELVLVLHGIDVDRDELRKRAADAGVGHLVLVRAPSTHTLGACLNAGIDAASGDYLAKLDDDNHYGSHYLTDLLHGFETSGAGIVGKWAHYVWLQSTGAVVLRYPDAEFSYQRRIQGGSMVFDGALLRELRFGDLPRAVDSDVLDRALDGGAKVWSGDRFNFVSIRGVDRTSHTWTVDDATFLTATGRLEFYGDPRAHVEV